MVANKHPPDEREAFSRRLQQAFDYAHTPKRDRRAKLAEFTGVSGEAARKWLEGLSILTTKRIPAIARKLGVNSEWLLMGTNPMTPHGDATPGRLLADTKAIAESRASYPALHDELRRFETLLRNGKISMGALKAFLDMIEEAQR